MHKNIVIEYSCIKQKSYHHPPTQTLTFLAHAIIFFLCNLGTSNSAAMGCSHPKEFRTDLRNILALLKVELQHFVGGTRALLRLPGARGLTSI